MQDHTNEILPTRAIYPTSRFAPYIVLLAVSKLARCFGLFLTYDVLKTVHVVQFLCIIKLGSAAVFLVLQKPFSSGTRLTKNQWLRIARHAFFGSVLNVLWLFGLTLCGPLRTIVLFEHSDIIVIAGASALFTNTGGGPSKFRGAVFFLLAVIGLLLFDHDDLVSKIADHPEGHHGSVITHSFYFVTAWIGLSDHMGGVVLLFVTLCASAVYHSAAKKLSVAVGGAKRLHALSTLFSFILLLPWALLVSSDTKQKSIFSLLPAIFTILLIVFIVDYYVENVSTNKLNANNVARYGTIAMLLGGLLLSCFWKDTYTAKIQVHKEFINVLAEEHMISGGVIFSLVLFIFATQILTSPNRAGRGGSFIGYSATGLPLYSITGEALQRTSHSILMVARSGLRAILEDPDSRSIFYFLCVNLAFTFVELTYGVWTNSLGLISDGFHMLFDCSALVMGLYAAVMSHWKATRIFSFGYDRVEVLSGFINALFLVVIAFFVFTEAIARLLDPPHINTDRLLAVSVAGLFVNFLGILAFRNSAFKHAHSHGGSSHGHNHGGGHGHSHGAGGTHGHSHNGHGHSHQSHGHSHAHGNTNMKGVFLHVLADTLGSVGVIISTILIKYFDWNIADPICSLFISAMIFLSVIPLFKEASMILLLSVPEGMEKQINEALNEVIKVEGVLGYRDQHFWQHSSDVLSGNIHLQVAPDASEQKILSQVTPILKDVGINNLTIQVEKEAYFEHMSGLGNSMEQVIEFTKNHQALNFDLQMIKAV
ncbi:proton-coupled zinc antiporter SLC30A5-like [Tubulanus polymorphus]|uniref:proton-coupled zinc antiporter SLC30A5-like n=1 Tax=Tubulanus polymorphus TaxID=672921 RepID=UPI003DA54E1F